MIYDSLEISKVLVIAPLRVARSTWPEEIEKWEHLKDLEYSVVVGDKKTRIAALNTQAQIYLVNREMVQWVVSYYTENGYTWDFDMIVIDELSSFKNHQSQRFRALRKVRPYAMRIVGLTGTPTSNGLMDLWAEIGILDQGQRLGRFIGRYREAYFKVGSMNPQTGIVYKYVPRDGAEEMIYARISDITVSMKALDYLDMPDCLYLRHYVDMEPQERKLYDQMKDDLIIPLEGGDIDAANAAALSNKLLQMSNGAVYDEEGKVRELHRHKLEMLEDLIESANGQSVLICYWFKHDRDRIFEYLKSVGYAPRDIRTTEDIQAWQRGEIEVGMIHPMAAGHGINLQSGGHILVWFGLTWSLELYQQANARLWRQGQKETVTIHHILTRNTVDDAVMAALETKDASQERLIAAVKAEIRK
jgi:SNF2 family DNA or RNA helicase